MCSQALMSEGKSCGWNPCDGAVSWAASEFFAMAKTAMPAPRSLKNSRRASSKWWIDAAGFLKTFDGGDWLSDRGGHGNLAGTARLAAEQHGAGAALPFSAAVLAAGEAEFVAQNVQQWSFRIVMNGIALAVHFNFGCGRHGAACDWETQIQ